MELSSINPIGSSGPTIQNVITMVIPNMDFRDSTVVVSFRIPFYYLSRLTKLRGKLIIQHLDKNKKTC